MSVQRIFLEERRKQRNSNKTKPSVHRETRRRTEVVTNSVAAQSRYEKRNSILAGEVASSRMWARQAQKSARAMGSLQTSSHALGFFSSVASSYVNTPLGHLFTRFRGVFDWPPPRPFRLVSEHDSGVLVPTRAKQFARFRPANKKIHRMTEGFFWRDGRDSNPQPLP